MKYFAPSASLKRCVGR